MNHKGVILVLFFAFVSCTLSSYLDIPPPPERPSRFKTKEQIENYLKAVKDYYDAFKIKLVRRGNSFPNTESDSDQLTNDNEDEVDEQLNLLQKFYNDYKLQQRYHPSRYFQAQKKENNMVD